MYSERGTLAGGFPHSDIFGSKPVCRLPEAFRRLPRPSSPVIAKASTTCTYSLDPIALHPALRAALSYKSNFPPDSASPPQNHLSRVCPASPRSLNRFLASHTIYTQAPLCRTQASGIRRQITSRPSIPSPDPAKDRFTSLLPHC